MENSPVSSTRGAAPASPPLASCVSLGGGKIVLSVAVGFSLAFASAASAQPWRGSRPVPAAASPPPAPAWPSRTGCDPLEALDLGDDVAVVALERADDRAFLGGEQLVLGFALQVRPAASPPADVAAAPLARRRPPTTAWRPRRRSACRGRARFLSFSASASALSFAALSAFASASAGSLIRIWRSRRCAGAFSYRNFFCSYISLSFASFLRGVLCDLGVGRRDLRLLAPAGEADVLEVDLPALAHELRLHLFRRHAHARAHEVAHPGRQHLFLLLRDEVVGSLLEGDADEVLERLVVEVSVLLEVGHARRRRRRPGS